MLKQAIKFFVTSGIGWIIDMCIYTVLSNILKVPVALANIISSFISVTYVYIVSTRNNFKNESSNISLKKKYIIYIVYQVIMILIFSFIISGLSSVLIKINYNIVIKYSKICAKILVTPITMICNFMFMKWLIEKFK
ncbi:MAG: GtrA family protein [Bacilli bacterium]|nr:GtrA family protein [Bacilli bacterium]